MKKTDTAFNMLDAIDEKHIEEAVNYKKKEKKISFSLVGWQKGLVAACLALAITLGVLAMSGVINPVNAVEGTPVPTPRVKDINVLTDFAKSGVRYYKEDSDGVYYYGKPGYDYFESVGSPSRIKGLISPKEFGDLSKLENAYLCVDNMSDYKFACEDGTEFHIMVNYKAWNRYQLDDDDKTIDWYNKANKAFADNMLSAYNYAAKLPEAAEYDPSLFSEDLNDCYDGSTDLILDGGNLVYSYVDGKLSCIWFYACDTLFEIYSDKKTDWVHSLDGWLSDLASMETAPRAAKRLRSISEASWKLALQDIYDRIEYGKETGHITYPDSWYRKDAEK